jgi:hypothetical protein
MLASINTWPSWRSNQRHAISRFDKLKALSPWKGGRKT